MARDMKTIESHQREHVEAVGVHDECDVSKNFNRDYFSTKKHDIPLDGADQILATQTWPTFSPLSAQFQYCSSEFLDQLYAKCIGPDDNTPWEMASRCWRGILFQRGLIIHKQETDEFFVSLGLMGQLMVGLWKVKPMGLECSGN